MLEALARQEVVLSPTSRHLEVFTLRGLLTVLWHGDPDAEAAVVLPGTRLGRTTGVAAGAVVRGEHPDHAVLAGVPAKVVRRWDAAHGWQPSLRDLRIDAPPGWPGAGT